MRAEVRERRWRCIGCGKRRLRRPHRFCKQCRALAADDLPVDMDDYPTKRECRKAIAAMTALLGPDRA
jgi:hypothetical protein